MKTPLPAAAPSALKAGSFFARYRDVIQAKGKSYGCGATDCTAPRYLPARKVPEGKQAIPRIIWMTVKDSQSVGFFQFQTMFQHWHKNLEYEWILVDDKGLEEFMESPEVKPEWRQAYASAVNWPERSDIWRLVVMNLYGGVYADQDLTAKESWSNIIDPEASVVQYLTEEKSPTHGTYNEVSQFVLLAAPNHPLMSTALDKIVRDMADPALVKRTPAAQLTGPGQLAWAWVSVMTEAGCGRPHLCKDALQRHSDAESNFVCAGLQSCKAPQVGKVVVVPPGNPWHKVDHCLSWESASTWDHNW